MNPRPIELPVEGLADALVRLRPAADFDAERITEICHDPEVTRWTTILPARRPSHTMEWFSRGAAGLASGTDVSLVIADAVTGEPVGTIGLHAIDHATGRAVAGYIVAPERRGQGVARSALRLICRFAFNELRLRRIEVTIEPENRASRAAAEAVGFHEEGLMRSYMPIADERRDMVMYSLLPGELQPDPSPG